MSTRDIAFSIFQQLSEDELKRFIALFRKAYPPKNDNMAERRAAFERMKKVCTSIPGLDEKKNLLNTGRRSTVIDTNVLIGFISKREPFFFAAYDIVTRNVKDYEHSSVPSILPEELLILI